MKRLKTHTQSGPESGSVLWFILIAIALLAALAIMISRTSQTAEQNGDTEANTINISALVRYAAGIEEAIEQMTSRGVSENELDFDSAQNAYPGSPCATTSCKVFDPGGGGQTYSLPPSGMNDGTPWLFTGADAVTGVGETDNPELLMILPGVTAALCQQLNTQAGITGIPQVSGRVDVATKFTGTFPASPLVIDTLIGQKTGCFQGRQDSNGADISGKYYFYFTLIAR